jgi:hypothetical protein
MYSVKDASGAIIFRTASEAPLSKAMFALRECWTESHRFGGQNNWFLRPAGSGVQ